MNPTVKRITGTLMTLALAGTLAACASSGTADAPAEEASGDEPIANMANPWSDAENASDAGTGAFGDTFDVPETLPVGDIAWQSPTFKYMDGIAEADYQGAAVEVCVRKGKDVSGEMLHGVYEDPEQPWIAWTVTVGDTEVACLGYEKDIANVLEWSKDGYNYSVFIQGVGGENYGVTEGDIAPLVESIW